MLPQWNPTLMQLVQAEGVLRQRNFELRGPRFILQIQETLLRVNSRAEGRKNRIIGHFNHLDNVQNPGNECESSPAPIV